MNKQLVLLKSELKLMNDASSILEYSYNKCLEIGTKQDYEIKELDAFENLISRFARLNDIIIQKVLRTIHSIDLDEVNTVRDSINLSEKKNLIENARDMIEMRELRNAILHEYIPDAIKTIFVKTLAFAPKLLTDVELINKYCKSKYEVS